MRLDLNIPVPTRADAIKAKLDPKLKDKLSAAEKIRVEKVAQEFEAVLLEKMLQDMRGTTLQSGLMGDGPGKKIFEEMLDGEYAKVMGKRGGIGIGKFMSAKMAQSMQGQK